MTKDEIVKIFRSVLEKDKISFVTPFQNNTSFLMQGINFDICNSVPNKTNRTYLKVDSLKDAKEIWTEVLDDLPKEKNVAKVFDEFVKTFAINLNKSLFLSIYCGKK